MCPRLLLNVAVRTFSVTGKNEGLLNSSNSILPCNIFQQNDLCILGIHAASYYQGKTCFHIPGETQVLTNI